jgi:hypothetical protein
MKAGSEVDDISRLLVKELGTDLGEELGIAS